MRAAFLLFATTPEKKKLFYFEGTILLAFGSILDWRSAPAHVVEAIFGALNELRDYRIIFAAREASTLNATLGAHILQTTWAPQRALLADHRTRLFVSHGGLKSVKEAICSRTPITFLPLFAEQAYNARQMARAHLATVVNKFTLTKERVLREMRRVSCEQKVAS